jgi:hypothetical protein
MDTFGSVDPYAIISFQECEYRTKTIKGSYTPEWNEAFHWDIRSAEKGCRTDFVVQINDWDAGSKDDEVGKFTIPALRMSQIVQARLGWEGVETFKLYQDGRGVVGHDKELSEVTVKMSVVEIPRAFGTLDIDPEAHGGRIVNVTLISANHLPKVLMMYSCVCIYIYTHISHVNMHIQ